MASFELPAAVAASLSRGVTPETALQVRRSIYSHEPLTPADMNIVFAVARKAGPNACPEWTSLFSEALTDYVVHENTPPDYIPERKAQWLMSELTKSGGISTKAEFAMLIDVMTSAFGVPPSLSAFALNEIKTAIVSGKRDAFGGADHSACVVTKSDVEALRAVLYAATTGSAGHVTKEEAEVLFQIADATANKAADSAFDDLFARAIGNYLMAISSQMPSTAEALHREAWLDERESMTGFFSRMLARTGLESFLDTLKSPLEAAEERLAEREVHEDALRAASEKITDGEAQWVEIHLMRDGKLSSAEVRLLDWLTAEAAVLPPSLRALAAKANKVKSRAA